MHDSTRTIVKLGIDGTLWHHDAVKVESRYETPTGTKHSRWRLVPPELYLRDGLDLLLYSQWLLRQV